MADAEAAGNADIIFRGVDGTECESFVVAIRNLAFAEGKDEDPNWMLRYATTRLRHKALRWHAKLDPSIRRDWDLFVQALFEEYPLVEDRDECGIATPVWTSTTFSPVTSTAPLLGNDCDPNTTTIPQPTGAEAGGPGRAQPSVSLVSHPQRYDSSVPTFYMGRLLVVYEGGQTRPSYVWGSDSATNNIHDALIVTFISSSKPHRIVCFGRGEDLGVKLKTPDYSESYRLWTNSYSDNPISLMSGTSQYIANIWTISLDGTLNATLPNLVPDPGNKHRYIPAGYYSTSMVHMDISGNSILITKGCGVSPATHPSSGRPLVRARIVFEPL